MRRPDEGLILQPVRVFARPRPKADISRLHNDLSSSHVLMTSGVLRLTRYNALS